MRRWDTGMGEFIGFGLFIGWLCFLLPGCWISGGLYACKYMIYNLLHIIKILMHRTGPGIFLNSGSPPSAAVSHFHITTLAYFHISLIHFHITTLAYFHISLISLIGFENSGKFPDLRRPKFRWYVQSLSGYGKASNYGK
jgi:hypothetical protein